MSQQSERGEAQNLILGLAVALGAGFIAWRLLASVEYDLDGISLAPALGAIAISGFVGYGGALAAGQSLAARIMWGARIAIALEVFVAWRVYNHASWPQAVVASVVLVALLIIHQMARSYARGWTVDEMGERQKVMERSRGRPFFDPTTYRERMLNEVNMRTRRRRALMVLTPLGGGAIWLAFQLSKEGSDIAAIAVCVVGAGILLAWLVCVVREVLYQLGYQDMKGHKVLDPEPVANLKMVSEQKAHGDAGLASEADALKLLRPGR